MAYTIESIARDVIKITIGVNDVLVTPVKILHTTYESEAADISVSPTITPVANVYTLTGNENDEFEITFNEDGIYKLSISEGDGSYKHYVVISNEVDDYFAEAIPELISNSPIEEYSKQIKYTERYDFNVISMFTMLFYGETNQYVYHDFEELTAGQVLEGCIYQATAIGSGSYKWTNSDEDILLINIDTGVTLEDTAPTLGGYYKCIKTGTPVSWGTSPSTLCAETEAYTNYIHNIADALYRFNLYTSEFIDT